MTPFDSSKSDGSGNPPVLETKVRAAQYASNVAYRYLPRFPVVDKNSFLETLCAGKRIVHLGAVDRSESSICGLHRRLIRVASSVVGVDNDLPGIALARTQGIDNIIPGDIENLEELKLADARPEIILATEVIEHLSNPGRFLQSVKNLMARDTQLVLSTPNCFAVHRFVYPLVRSEKVHVEHVSYYSFHTLVNLLTRFEYEIQTVLGYVLQGRGSRVVRWLSVPFPHYATGLIAIATLKVEGSLAIWNCVG